ncbi:MAG: 4Fe-4S binding protein [Coriobacteriales bacterium]|nr:4Fe-4S binding protein [Coriobacteriales bacterium]
MSVELLMGNQALGLGALRAGVNCVSGYPGTPSTEVLEYIASQARKRDLAGLHIEWSTNEKIALEVGAGVALSGGRALVTMKQVGLNVASDPLMSLPYLGVGGLVLLVADDPGPISSQTEQDTRQFAQFAKVPVLDPSTPEEACAMMEEAFQLSAKYSTPVIVRSTTRVSHAAVSLESSYDYSARLVSGFEPSERWVIFPRRSYMGHLEIIERLQKLQETFAESSFNLIEQTGHSAAPAHLGLVAGGNSWAYLKDALQELGYAGSLRLLKIGTPHPFPDSLVWSFIKDLDEVLVFEELEPVIERELLRLIGQRREIRGNLRVRGKLDGTTEQAGEGSTARILQHLLDFLSVDGPGGGSSAEAGDAVIVGQSAPTLPIRPPVLCAGCPHRASFFAIKQALMGRKAVFSGDIGCYTLGNALPLDMVDTCLCMGAGFTIPQGMAWAEPDSLHLGFVGDSTFFASGLTGVVNAVASGVKLTLVVLDNSITAMTGGQTHVGQKLPGDIPSILRALGVPWVAEIDPFDQQAARDAVCEAVAQVGVSAIVFKSPCVTFCKSTAKGAGLSGDASENARAPRKAPQFVSVNPENCRNCKLCLRKLGCPALVSGQTQMQIDAGLCTACGLCTSVCPFQALEISEASGVDYE